MPRSFRGYEIGEKIGSGGMSTIYLGTQTSLKRPIAIKMLHPALADDEQFIARFEREARAASAIGHRNIVSVIDFGSEDDVYFIAMEYVRGMDMKDSLERAGKLPPEIVLAVLEEVSYGLQAAHEQEIVHRDIKPGNVMINTSGEVKVADFGLAAQATDMARLSALTVPGSVLGTPAYMSPEQAAGKEVDHRSDIYSLGVMAYELLTNEKPFPGASYSEIRDKIISSDPRPLSDCVAVTPEIEALINRMIAKDPDRRFASMRQVLRNIEDCMETIDPSGGLVKFRRKYLTKFAKDPAGFSNELRRAATSSHLDRGFYFKNMGLSKISDAIREFRYVLFLDPDNSKAHTAIRDLEREASESGIQLPGASGSSGVRAGATAVLPGGSPHEEGATKVLRDASDEPQEHGRTVVVEAGDSKGRAPWRGMLIGVAIVAVAVVVWWLWPPALIDLVVTSEPTGASVFVRASGDEGFRDTGSVTNCTLEQLPRGSWEIRLDLEGYESQVVRADVDAEGESLSIDLIPMASVGQLAVTSDPAGATMSVKAPGESEFRSVEGTTPLEVDLAPGSWGLRLESGGRIITRSEVVRAGKTSEVSLSFARDFDSGMIRVSTDPTRASVEVRRKGNSRWENVGASPVTTKRLPVGSWEVRARRAGFRNKVVAVSVEKDVPALISMSLAESSAPDPPNPPTPAVSFIALEAIPFADVYVDGELVEREARSSVIPVSPGASHVVELRHPAGVKEYASLQIADGDTLRLAPVRFEWGRTRIYTSPMRVAEVFVDGVSLGQTPYNGRIATGMHRVNLELEGHRMSQAIVTDELGASRTAPVGPDGSVEVEVDAGEMVVIELRVTIGE